MFASRLSRLLSQIAKEAVKGCKTFTFSGPLPLSRPLLMRKQLIMAMMTTFSVNSEDVDLIRKEMSFYPVLSESHKNRLFYTTGSEKTHEEGAEQKEAISVTFVNKDGEEKLIKVPIGMSMLEAAHQNDIELEGACEGSLACSTCHVIVMDVNYYNKLEEPTDEENDMLDLAFGLTETSRLGCQVIAKPELEGIRLALPAATRNFAVDGYVPKPH